MSDKDRMRPLADMDPEAQDILLRYVCPNTGMTGAVVWEIARLGQEDRLGPPTEPDR